MARVLVVATSRKTRGGITAVIRAYEKSAQWTKFHCHWVQTHRDGVAWRKVLYLVMGFLDYMFRLPFYDIVHVHLSLTSSAIRKEAFVRIAKLFNKKVVVHLHCGSQIDEIWNDHYQYLFTYSDVSLCLSETLKKKIEAYIGVANNLDVCYNPCHKISTEMSYCTENSILFSGSLCSGKGYQDLIMAFSMIYFKYPEWKLVFVGNGEIDMAKRLVRKHNIEGRVQFRGWVNGEEKARAFRHASIFCLPSYSEGFPMGVLDAWAYALPVITTPVGGIPDVAKDGENMLLFTPGDVEALSEKLEMLMSDASLRNKISNASRELAETTFNMDNISAQLEGIYNNLVGSASLTNMTN